LARQKALKHGGSSGLQVSFDWHNMENIIRSSYKNFTLEKRGRKLLDGMTIDIDEKDGKK